METITCIKWHLQNGRDMVQGHTLPWSLLGVGDLLINCNQNPAIFLDGVIWLKQSNKNPATFFDGVIG